ncbi:MAG: polysaccharide deacetylase family protein [Granulosicoccaceae bacterium]
MSPGWQRFEAELAQWSHPAPLWWRDDDAVADTQALRQLIELQQGGSKVPLHLASIPGSLESSLPDLIGKSPNTWILQHGYNHHNHALPGQKKIELGGELSTDELMARLGRGRHILVAAFAERYVDIIVPPWNRYDEAATTAIGHLGYKALSGLGLRTKKPAPFPQLNVHIDIIDWREGRFIGTEACLTEITQKLASRRLGHSDSTEPLGLMTHHLAHDGGCWDFLREFMFKTAEHPKIKWLEAKETLKA